LFAAAETLREKSGVQLRPSERADHDRDVAAVRAGLGDEPFQSAWSEGRTMGPEQAIEYALARERH